MAARNMAQPAERVINHIFCSPLDSLVTIHSATAQMKAGIVDFKAAIKSGSGTIERIEDDRPNKRAGVITALLEQIRADTAVCGESGIPKSFT